MNMQRFILISVIAGAVLQIIYYYPLLPQTVASHFDISGNPNGCSSKRQLIGIYGVIILVMLFSFRVLPSFFKNIPVSFINLPNKDYWLAPERKEETFRVIVEKMLSLGNATTFFLLITFQLAFEANLNITRHFSSVTMLMLLGGYILFAVVWSVRFIARFRRTKQ
jgi:uncharacterized membrane protein